MPTLRVGTLRDPGLQARLRAAWRGLRGRRGVLFAGGLVAGVLARLLAP